jgi:predicted nuclease with TOPRIM domain
MSSTEIEKESLEAHVELCAERYKNLDNKLNSLENRMERLESLTVDIKDRLTEKLSSAGVENQKQLITIGLSIFGILATALTGLIIKLLVG